MTPPFQGSSPVMGELRRPWPGIARAAVQYVDTTVGAVSNVCHHPGGNRFNDWIQADTLPDFCLLGPFRVKKIPLELALAPREAPTRRKLQTMPIRPVWWNCWRRRRRLTSGWCGFKSREHQRSPSDTLIREQRTAWAEPLRMCPTAWVSYNPCSSMAVWVWAKPT
jgi:hypothetical protein